MSTTYSQVVQKNTIISIHVSISICTKNDKAHVKC